MRNRFVAGRETAKVERVYVRRRILETPIAQRYDRLREQRWCMRDCCIVVGRIPDFDVRRPTKSILYPAVCAPKEA